MLALLGFTVRLVAVGSESLWYDELLQLDIAQSSLADLLLQLPKHAAVPLDYLLLHFWGTGGQNESWVRLPAVIMGTLTLPLAFQLGRSWLDERTGLVLMALLTLAPFHVRYSQEARPYALLLFGVMLAGYAWWQVRQGGGWRYLILLQLGVLIFSLAHFFAIVIFIPWFVVALSDSLASRRWLTVWQSLGSLALTGLVALLLLLALGWGRTLWNVTWWGFGQALIETERFTVEAAQKPNFETGPQLTPLFFRNKILRPMIGGDYTPVLIGFGLIAGLGLIDLLKRRTYKVSLAVGLWLVLPVLVIIAFLRQRGAFFEPRYIISVLPAYLFFLAAGLLAIPRWVSRVGRPGLAWVTTGLLAGVVIVNAAVALHTFYVTHENENWRLVGRLLAQNAGPEDAVLAVNAEATLNWYYPAARAAPDQFDTLAAVHAAVDSAERGWVVISGYSNYIPETKRIRTWLFEQGAVRLEVDPNIAVYYLGTRANPPQLLAEVRGFALPVYHRLYAELARQNQREPAIARRYYQIALEYAPDPLSRAEYQAALQALPTP
jgi:uncharacterized membrane protein